MDSFKKNKAKRIVSCSFFALLIIILVFVAVPLLPNAPYSLRIVTSGSMRPTFDTGSLIVTFPKDDYSGGDIITFTFDEGETFTTHRIHDIKVVGGEVIYITKGDANKAEDISDVYKENVKGKMLFSVPYVGYAVDFFRSSMGFALLIFISAGIIIYDQGQKIFKETKKLKKKDNQDE